MNTSSLDGVMWMEFPINLNVILYSDIGRYLELLIGKLITDKMNRRRRLFWALGELNT